LGLFLAAGFLNELGSYFGENLDLDFLGKCPFSFRQKYYFTEIKFLTKNIPC